MLQGGSVAAEKMPPAGNTKLPPGGSKGAEAFEAT